MTTLTGDDIADLHQEAERQQFGWRTTHGLPVPYVVDEHERIVYVDGRLDVQHYFEALRRGAAELPQLGELLYLPRPEYAHRGAV